MWLPGLLGRKSDNLINSVVAAHPIENRLEQPQALIQVEFSVERVLFNRSIALYCA